MGKLAILFPGQGAQTVGMGREIYDANASIRDMYDQASEILGYDIVKVCFEGPVELLNTTEQSQPAIYLTSMAMLEALKTTEPETVRSAQASAGLSLGEYTALAFAGVFSFEAGLRLVQARGRAMQKAAETVESGMVSILGLDVEKVESLCSSVEGQGTIRVANYLCPGNLAVSGTKAACEQVARMATEAGAIKVVPLAVAGAFHTEIMQSAAESLKAFLEETVFSAPRIPVISNVDCQAHTNPDEIRSILLRQLCSPVRWEASMRFLLDSEFDTFYEVGPGRVLRGLMKRISRKVTLN